VIELVNLVKKFGDLTAVNDISLTIPRGEFFAMLGPNAAGKTTTLKLLAGLMKPTAGCARVGGFDMQSPIFRFSTTSSPRGNFSASPASCFACRRRKSRPTRRSSSCAFISPIL
jgi:ABC-type cobalamin/Fe3+-siderophores transport system ATPase subunit